MTTRQKGAVAATVVAVLIGLVAMVLGVAAVWSLPNSLMQHRLAITAWIAFIVAVIVGAIGGGLWAE